LFQEKVTGITIILAALSLIAIFGPLKKGKIPYSF
jgi:hypothetical protein